MIFLKNNLKIKILIVWATVLFTPFARGSETITDNNKHDNTENYQSFDSLFSLYQPYLGNISAYKPMYFLVGTEPKNSKFQISFKYRFFNPEASIARHYRWVKGFHFAYTQTSFWDLEARSKPFEDTSYKPEFFYISPNMYKKENRKFFRLFIKTGYEHESNGRDEEYSRSTNYIYLQPIFIFYHRNTSLGLQFAPKLWAYVANDDETNPDLKDYKGYFDFEVICGRADSFVLESHFWLAEKGGSMQFDLTYPLHRFLFNNLELYFHMEYVNRLGESFRTYDEHIEAFRLGVAIVR